MTVPQEHIGTRTVCKNSICQPDGPNGVGVPDTDLLIYVTANESGTHYPCNLYVCNDDKISKFGTALFS